MQQFTRDNNNVAINTLQLTKLNQILHILLAFVIHDQSLKCGIVNEVDENENNEMKAINGSTHKRAHLSRTEQIQLQHFL